MSRLQSMSALSLEQGPNYNSNQTMPRAILLLLIVTAAWGDAAAVAPERIHYTGKIGHIVRLQDGRLLTLYTLGRAGEDSSLDGSEQPAYVRYSGDRGYSWSKARIAFSYAPGRGTMPTYRQSAGPFLCQTTDGSVLLRYHRIERTLGITRRDLLRIDPEWIAESSTKPDSTPAGR